MENSTTKQSFYKIWSVKIDKKKKHKRMRKVHKEDEKQEYLQEKCIFLQLQANYHCHSSWEKFPQGDILISHLV